MVFSNFHDINMTTVWQWTNGPTTTNDNYYVMPLKGELGYAQLTFPEVSASWLHHTKGYDHS